jgi:hypothetical protein
MRNSREDESKPKNPIQKPLQQIVCGKKNSQAYMVVRAHYGDGP